MKERPKTGWQAWLAGALFLGLLALALLIGSQQSAPPPSSEAPAVAVAKPTPAPVVPRPEPPLERAGLIGIANAAASAFAIGASPSAEEPALVGRRFELRQPFGCDGPVATASNVAAGWRYDADKETLKVFVEPQDWTHAPWIRLAVGTAEFEAAQGFPIERPWILNASCPAPRPAAVEVGPTSKVSPDPRGDEVSTITPPVAATPGAGAEAPPLALLQLFTAEAPRAAARGDRGYQAVVKRKPDEIPADLSFFLVLNGRIAALPTGRATACWGESSKAPPRCIIAAEIDRVSIVDSTGAQLAEWAQ